MTIAGQNTLLFYIVPKYQKTEMNTTARVCMTKFRIFSWEKSAYVRMKNIHIVVNRGAVISMHAK